MTTGLEIALFILGAAFIIISFFIVDSKDKYKESLSQRADSEGLDELREAFVESAEKEANAILQDTKDKLEDVSNDKIIAVGEYSDQIMDKINTNHNEVVFLYQMLKDKEEELKNTTQNLDNVRIECEKVINSKEQLEELKNSLMELKSASVSDISYEPVREIRKTEVKKQAAKSETKTAIGSGKTAASSKSDTAAKKTAVKRTSAKTAATGQTEKDIIKELPPTNIENYDTGDINHNDEIIALYRQKKSVMEISKLLGMGQGEVKLIIDLYCR